MGKRHNPAVQKFLAETTKPDLYDALVFEKQAKVSFENMMKQFHKLAFLSLLELYKIDKNNNDKPNLERKTEL